MITEISHDFEEETMEAKARWFQALSLSERMDMLCEFTDMILETNPGIAEMHDVEQVISERIPFRRGLPIPNNQ
ncbi:MAG: hypothetical protein GY757_24120 [bacterium]|nr:hypothetical protein [bacterium]